MKPWTYLVFLLILIGIFYFGYSIYPRINPCPEVRSDTIYKTDTIERIIVDRIPYYIYRTDSIVYRQQEWVDSLFQANKEDTIIILNDYFAIHHYTQNWRDSLLFASEESAISENKIIDSHFTYRISQPSHQIINNIITGSSNKRSVYAGLNVPVSFPKYSEAEILIIHPKFYFGAGYCPGLPSLTIKAGFKISAF